MNKEFVDESITFLNYETTWNQLKMINYIKSLFNKIKEIDTDLITVNYRMNKPGYFNIAIFYGKQCICITKYTESLIPQEDIKLKQDGKNNIEFYPFLCSDCLVA